MKVSNFWYKFFKYAPGVCGAFAVFAETVLPAWGCPDGLSKAIVITLGALCTLFATLSKIASDAFWKDNKILTNEEYIAAQQGGDEA